MEKIIIRYYREQAKKIIQQWGIILEDFKIIQTLVIETSSAKPFTTLLHPDFSMIYQSKSEPKDRIVPHQYLIEVSDKEHLEEIQKICQIHYVSPFTNLLIVETKNKKDLQNMTCVEKIEPNCYFSVCA